MKPIGNMDSPEQAAVIELLNSCREGSEEAKRLLEDPRVLRAAIVLIWSHWEHALNIGLEEHDETRGQ